MSEPITSRFEALSHPDLDQLLTGASQAIAHAFRRPRVERRTVYQDGRSVTPLYDHNRWNAGHARTLWLLHG